MLKIEPSRYPVYIQDLSRKIQTGRTPASLTGDRIYFRQTNSPGRHEFFLKGRLSRNNKLTRAQNTHQPVLILPRQIGPAQPRRNPGR